MAGFLVTLSGKSLETRLAGWRSSADAPLLCPFSLLRGNFTGNFRYYGADATGNSCGSHDIVPGKVPGEDST